MTQTYRACRACHAPTSPRRLDAVSGAEKALSVTLRGLTVLACPEGHQQFLRADAPLELLDHLIEEDEAQLPAGTSKGLIFKHFFCSACGGELQPKPDHTHTFTLTPAIADQPGLEVDLTIAVYKCGTCAKEQLHSLNEVRKLTPNALAHAFQAAAIQSG